MKNEAPRGRAAIGIKEEAADTMGAMGYSGSDRYAHRAGHMECPDRGIWRGARTRESECAYPRVDLQLLCDAVGDGDRTGELDEGASVVTPGLEAPLLTQKREAHHGHDDRDDGHDDNQLKKRETGLA